MRDVDLPLITIITVVLNSAELLEKTIESVVSQSYPNIEYIVIDGGSTDNTLDVIKKYTKKINYWHSKKDFGIYDAMNIGLTKASGQWVNFMNAGDVFFEIDTIIKIFGYQKQTATIIYGSVEIVYPDMIRVQNHGCPDKLWQGMQFSHQSAFVNLHYHQSNPFDTSILIAADLAFFYQAFKSGVIFFSCNQIVARVIIGGLSEDNRIRAVLSSCDAVCRDQFRPLIRMYYFLLVINTILRSALKYSLPRFLIKKIILLK